MKTKNTAFKGLILFLLILLCIGAAYAAEDTVSDNPNIDDASFSLGETSLSDTDDSDISLSQEQDSANAIDENSINDDSKTNLGANQLGDAKSIYVKKGAKNGDGSEEKPFGDIKSAVSIAADGDTIIIANGSYTGVDNSNLTISQSGLTIKAAEGATPSISGSSARRIFTLTGSNIFLQGLFLTSGRINSDYGGGVLIASDGITIKNCTFYNCKAKYGGAIFISGNNIAIDDCEFKSNTAIDINITRGGAIYINGGLSNILVNNSRFGVNGYNRGDNGGAVFMSSSAVFNNSIFSNNIADSNGGAFYVTNAASNSVFDNCIFNGNVAYGYYAAVTGGGAMAIYGTSNKIINSQFTKNWNGDNGGALLVYRSNNQIINTSFDENKAARGGAICFRLLSNDVNENNSIIGCNFTGNGKPFSYSKGVFSKGGAIFSYADKTYILDSKFEDNIAMSGGAILFACNLEGNSADDNTIENSTFINNQAVRYGGGAISSASTGDKVLNSTFISNTAKNYGGALSMDYVDVYNSTFTDNMAIEGTAIYAIETYVEGSDFTGSKVADEGNENQNSKVLSSSLQESGEGKVIVGLNKAEVKDSNINDDDVVSFGISDIHKADYTDLLIAIDNNYIGYCAENYSDAAVKGVIWENLSIFRNSLDSSNVADYLKVLIWEYFKDTSDDNSLQAQVDIFADEDYMNSDDPIVKDVIEKVNSGMRIDSENAIKVLDNGTIVAYNFKALIVPQASQNVFIFNLSEVNESVVKETLTPVVVKGQEAKFNITLTNNGENNITGAYINDSDFDPELIYSSFESDSEDYDWIYNESSKIWILNKTLEPGQSASIIISFKTTKSGEFRNNVSCGLGNHTFGNSSNVTKVISPNMTVEKVSNNQTVEVGEKVSFTITVKNTGDCNLTGVYIKDSDYSDGLEYDSFVEISGKWSFDGKDTWNYEGELGVGESASIELIFVAKTSGEKVNTAIAGNNITNDTVNSTNVTNVTETPEENTTNDTEEDVPEEDVPEEDIPEEDVPEDTPEDVPNETPKKTLKVDNATGNPLFALVIVLSILGFVPLRRRK